MIEYEYKSLNHANGDWLVDKILEGGGVITDDHFKGKLVEAKATYRQLILEYDAIIVDFVYDGKDVAVCLLANDGNKALLLQHTKAFLQNKETAMAILIDFNNTVKSALEKEAQARMRQAMLANRPVVQPRK